MRVMVLLSGGVDSVTMAAHAQASGHAVFACFVDYEQPAAVVEHLAARAWCLLNDAPLTFCRVKGPPLGQMADGIGPQVVPARNALLVSLALGAAAANDCEVVWLGATADDFADYADCRPAWVEAMNTVALMATGIRVDAPFSGWTKRQVFKRAAELGVRTDQTWSCYQPQDGKPCGECTSCQARRWATEIPV